MNAGGSPPFFKSPEEIERKIEEYYFFIEGEFEEIFVPNPLTGQLEKIKDYTRNPETPSITGLALYLGFESRQSIYDYEKKGEFSYTIKRAKLKIESHYEQHLLTKVSTGAIFALKNFGWTDKQEIENNVNISNISIKDLVQFDDDEECGS